MNSLLPITEEISAQFKNMVDAINRKDADSWEKYYSRNAFVSATAGGHFFATRKEWVDAITSNFSLRELQQLNVLEMKIVPLTNDTAILTSQNSVEMKLKNRQSTKYQHAYTMIWEKEPDGWLIIHSHESWEDIL